MCSSVISVSSTPARVYAKEALQPVLRGEVKIAIVALIKSRKENPKKLTRLSPRSHTRHLVGKRTA